MTSSLRHA